MATPYAAASRKTCGSARPVGLLISGGACLPAIARSYEARGGAVRLIEASRGVERYYEVQQRLAGGRS